MNANRTRAHFYTIDDQVVGFGAHLFRRSFQHVKVFIHGHGEGVMGRNIPLLVFIPFKQRKLRYPENMIGFFINHIELVTKL